MTSSVDRQIAPVAPAKAGRADLVVAIDRAQVPDFLLQAYLQAERGEHEMALSLLTEARLQTITALPAGSEAALATHCLLAKTWQQLDRLPEAAASYEMVRHHRGDLAVLVELAKLYRGVGRFTQALSCYRDILQRQPDWAAMQLGEAVCMIQTGDYAAGMRRMADLIEREEATAEMHLNYLFYLYYDPAMDRAGFLQAYRRWAQRYEQPISVTRGYDHDRSPERRLRIGYLSTDFRRHSVCTTFEPMLMGHDANVVETYGYGYVTAPDATTARMQTHFDHYRDVTHWEPTAIAERITKDRIDILVGLASHCSAVLMETLVQRAAPIQVDIGSMSSTGLDCVDYRIADPIQDPPAAQPHYSETLQHMEGGYVPFRPPVHQEPVSPLPALRNGYVTFGSFSNHLKINSQVVTVWAQILNQVPQSRLIIKCPGGMDEPIRERLWQSFAEQGVASERIQLLGYLTEAAHWRCFHRIDIALDTFPYNGGLTTLEALWMGIPTVSVVGQTAMGRVGQMLLSYMNLKGLVGSDPDHMATIAVGLAQNLPVLTRLRGHLRSVLLASPMCDIPRLACDVEAAYRTMWRNWCAESESRGGSV